MESNQFLNLIKTRKSTIISIALIFLILVLVVTFIQPLKYRATTKILITQNYGATADAYSVSRSNQFISSVLSQVIYSDLFFEDVLNSGFNIDNNIFSSDINKKKKQWQKMIKPIVINDSGMIVVHTYYQDKYQVGQINQAIAYTLKTKHNIYHGLGNRVNVKIIDKTIVSNFPVKPNVILNVVFGLVIGILLGIGFVYLYPNKKISIRKSSKKKIENQGYKFNDQEYADDDSAMLPANDGTGSTDDEDDDYEEEGNISNIL